MRNHGRFGFMLAALAGVSLASTQAHADDATSSTGAASIKFDQTTGLGTGITTGPLPADSDLAQIEVQVSLDPVANGGPLYSVDMPKGALIQASWAKDKKIVFKAQQGSSSDGRVTVRHTLAPTFDLKIKKFFPTTVHYDASELLNLIPGAKFDFDSKAQQAFAPWGFAGVNTKLTRPNLETTTLFSLGFDKLPKIGEIATGKVGVAATTSPTFTYKTTKIFLAGANGELSNATSELSLPATDGDYIEIMAAVEGEMQAKGSLTVIPYLKIDKIGENNVGFEFKLPQISKDYESAVQKVPFQTVAVHIPMPNVHTPSNGVNLGDVKVGGSGNKKVTIENSGEKEAVLRFDSTDSAFEVPGNTVTVPPKTTYDLQVKFSPVNANPASATITVNSNDADSPEQTFKIGANGADVGDDGQATTDADSGCGCRAAGSTSPVNGWAGAGLAGLAVVLGLRRRRSQPRGV